MKMLPYIARRSVCRWGRGSLCPNVAMHAKSLSASTCLNVKLLQHPWWNGLGLNQTSEKRRSDSIFYRKIIGKLIHLTHTHPDLSYCVGIVSRFMSKPQLSHLEACKRIFRYDASTWDYGILFRNHESSILSGFVDSDRGGEISSGRITTSLVFRLGSSPVSWFSKK